MELKLKDIAQKAGVSVTAVSFALNGKEGISEKTRQKILRIAEQEGYSSKKLIQKKEDSSRLIFLLYPVSGAKEEEENTDAYSFYEIMQKVEQQIHTYNYNLFFKSVSMQGDFRKEIEKIISFYQVEGMIVVGTQMSSAQIRAIRNVPVPVVVIDRFFSELNIDCIAFDNFAGAYAAVTYLIAKNHRRIGYVGTHSDNRNLTERRDGYMAALKERGLQADPTYCLFDIKGEDKERWEQLLGNQRLMPSAFLVENDYLASDIIKELQEAGIKVPEEVSVIGFENSVVADLITPELTSVEVPWDRMAFFSVRRLMEKLQNGEEDTLKIRISTKMVIRDSCRDH